MDNMNKKIIYGGIIIILLALFTIGVSLFIKIYKPFRIRAEDNCEVYYQKCICIGSLYTSESRPLQYKCVGIKFCRDINEIKCE